MIKKLENHKSAQAHILEYNDKEILVSYATDVLIIDYDSNIMEVTGLYSMTTRRHISWYLMERFPHLNYYIIKKAYEQGKKVNVLTGDLI